MNNRYKRQINLIGEEGQEKLKQAIVVVVGAGGIGNIAAKFLASAGVGCIEVWDHDKIELSNLNRQVMFNTDSIGKYKARILIEVMNKVNPEGDYCTHIEKFEEPYTLCEVDLVLDCTDTIESARFIEKEALRCGIPCIFAKTSNFSGTVKLIKDKPFLEESYPHVQLNENHDVFPTLGAIIGGMQAGLAIKYLSGLKYDQDMLYYDALNNITKRIKV